MPTTICRTTMNCKRVSLSLAVLIASSLAGSAIAQAGDASAKEQEAKAAAAAKAAQEKAQQVQQGVSPEQAKVDPASGKKIFPPLPGNAWFAVTDQDLGTHFSQDTAIGRFPFKNPTKADVVWKSLIGSCQCSKAFISVGDRRYRFTNKPQANTIYRITVTGDGEREERVSQIEVGPEEGGEIEVHMELGGVTGTKQASLDIHTDDQQTPQIKLRWHAVGAQVFVLSPTEVNLNQMVWNEKRDFTVAVQSPIQPDFNIVGYDDTDHDFQVTYDKAEKDGTATWTIHGSYSPHSADVLGGGVLKFTTDVKGQPTFSVRISAAIQGPLEVKPGTFLTLGMIRKGTSRTERVVFEPNDGTDLDTEDIKLERLTIDPKFVITRKSKDGKKLIVELEVSSEAPGGLLRGDLVVHLNHPAIKEKKILFNGFIR